MTRMRDFGLAPWMLASGLAGIAYEVLYGRLLGNLLGDQFTVSAAVLMTFLLGIGIGARFAWRLWRWLWLIELGIGAFSLVFVLLLDPIDAWLYAADSLEGATLRAVALLLPPALLIGCSVPLFAGHAERSSPREAFARAYAVYNIGAAITALAIEFVLLRAFGIRATVLLFAALNAGIAWGLWRRGAPPAPKSPKARALPARTLAIVMPLGIASAIFQLLVIKWAEMLFGPFRESFAIVLSLVLAGIAAGAWLVRRDSLNVAQTALAAALGCALTLVAFSPAIEWYAHGYPHAAGHGATVVLLKWAILALLAGIPALAFGAVLPALARNGDNAGIEAGRLLFAGATANALGFAAMTFVLHERLDYGQIVLIVVMLAALAAFVAAGDRRGRIMAALVPLVAAVGWQTQWDERLLYLSYTEFRDPKDLARARAGLESSQVFKGRQDVFAINIIDGEPYFFINGYTSIPLNNPSEKVVGVLGSAFAPRRDAALVLGLGSGATASVVGLLFRHTDVVEINPVVRAQQWRMRRWNFDIERNPRVAIHLDDAMHFLKRPQRRYDLILNTVTTPLYFSSSKLYTLEFLDRVKARLQRDGVYVSWMDARIGDRGADIVLRTLRQRFNHCSLAYIKSAYFLLLCSDAPLPPAQAPSSRPVATRLLRAHGIPAEWIPDQLIAPDAWRLIGDSSAPLNTLDRPALEFEMARLDNSGIPGLRRRILKQLRPDAIRRALARNDRDFAYEWLWQAWLRLEDSAFTLAWQQRLQARDADFRPRLERVIRNYDRRLKAAGAKAGVWHHFGYVMMEMNYVEDAILLFERALRLDPAHNNSHFNLAACHERLGNLELALKHYRLELTVDADDEDVPWRIGRVLARQGRWRQALPWLEQAAKRMGDDAPGALADYLRRARRAGRS